MYYRGFLHISTVIRDSGKCNPMKYGKNSCRRYLHKSKAENGMVHVSWPMLYVNVNTCQ